MTWVLGFLVWFFLCFVVAQYADNKGRSGIVWWFVSFLFSPIIGWLVLLVAEPNDAALEARALKGGTGKRCPACAEIVRAKATRCKHCGADLAA